MPLQALVNGLGKCTVLTKREKEILQHANKGLRNKEIASCCLSVQEQLKSTLIFRKLQVCNKIEALNKIKHL